MGDAGRWKMIAFAPLIFGLAHVHHGWDTHNRPGRSKDALKRAVLSTIFQTLNTTLFGAHTSYLFLRMSSLISPSPRFPGQEKARSETHGPAAIIVMYILGIALSAYKLVPWKESHGAVSLYWRGLEAFWRPVLGTSWAASFGVVLWDLNNSILGFTCSPGSR
ncbi:hypothetical protein MVEN_02331300 [Mycena venus]|uniref:intramembrane prenyl-peptidase Rce1 n=1 Tax=Mycena venus TaxID=2733690 RepID=A0A8H7CF72_9AGAR|nr:hypothetical protein MVEN_02331300 [Mycena venus]